MFFSLYRFSYFLYKSKIFFKTSNIILLVIFDNFRFNNIQIVNRIESLEMEFTINVNIIQSFIIAEIIIFYDLRLSKGIQ